MNKSISGGYYLKARCIQDSNVAHMPPYVREVWDWLLKEANHKDNEKIGLKRGQLLRTFKDIQEGLYWNIGWRKMTYKKWQCEKSMKLLMKATMIATTKTTRGLIITICNYNHFQEPRNYESNNDSNRRATVQKQTTATINNNDKNVNNDNTKTYTPEITKESKEPNGNTLMATNYFYKAYANQFKKQYFASFKKDGKIMKDLLLCIKVEELYMLIDRFFNSKDEFILNSAYGTEVFRSQINKLQITVKKEKVNYDFH